MNAKTEPKSPPKTSPVAAEKAKRITREQRAKKAAPVVVKKGPKKTEADARPPRGREGRDGHRDGHGTKPDADRMNGARFVGGPRNEHGTRIARRVTCARCGTSDHVPYVPKDPARALCRACAIEVLKTYDAGVKVRMPTRETKCNLCGTPFNLPISAEDDGDPLCHNCLQGFTTWQGSVDTPFEVRAQSVVEERLSGALIRKKKKP